MVDDYEQFENNDRTDVVVVSPAGSTSNDVDMEPLLANDYEAMMAKALPVDPDLEVEAETYHTWHIKNWTKLPRREHGPKFECAGAPWRILFFPYGNQVEYASFYLEHGWEDNAPEDWYACVQFALVLWNPNHPDIYISNRASHRFNAEESDWGFTRFAELRRLFQHIHDDRGVPLVENQEACLTAYVRVVKDPTGVLWHSFQNYNSKKETGMVGLRNQGATCYLNSLLQSLFFTNAFRKAVYQIPTEDEASKKNSAWTLQRLFYSLQTCDTPVSTSELTESFGWKSRVIFEQQDVQELSRLLMEKLEAQMKGTPAELALPNLFVGKTKTYISCINVDYESSRIEDFWDIQLSVKGNKTLDDSFKSYINVEIMDGENKYDAGAPHGLQDARKGVIFESFPPVLHLHLQRYEYDFNRDAMMKINDRHEFPEEFDAAPYLSADADMSEPWEYKLFGVLVHSGDLNAGHYYAFLRPTKDGHFYKFDDDKVIRATAKETLEENFGGEYANGAGMRQPYTRNYSTKRSMNAYMLVYIRKSKINDVLISVGNDDVPFHVAKQVDEERAETIRKKKEREEQHLYMNIAVVSDETFRQHHSFDLMSTDLDSGDPALPTTYRVRRTMKVGEFTKLVAEDKGLDPERVRLWAMVNRQNKTVRPDQPLRDPEDTVESAALKQSPRGPPFKVYIEVREPGEDGKVVWPETQGSNASVLVILKHFDAATQTLSGVGHVFVKKQSKVSELAGPILQMMKWPTGTLLSLYEEIKPSMIDQLKPKQTFQASEIQDGDIICFQRTQSDVELGPNVLYKDATKYYDYLLNRVMIKFAPIKAESDDSTFTLALSRKMNYEQFSTKVGEYLKVDPTHLRFAPVATNTGNPKPFIRRNVAQTLAQILHTQYSAYGNSGQRNDALYYEILETSLSEYETKKLLKISWLPEGIVKEQPYELLVPKQGNVADILQGLQQKAGLDDETMHNVRVFEAHYSKMQKELTDKFAVAGIMDTISLYAEPIPEDERNMKECDFRINAFNFDKEPNKEHGIPFKFVVKPGEKFSDTKQRLSKRTGIRGKQFEKIKFAVVSRAMYSNPKYLEDDDILAELVGDSDSQLGLNHVNKNRNFFSKSDNIFIR
ncbi:ubiquitin-specific protease ubp15 [Microsporum ferrugineum]